MSSTLPTDFLSQGLLSLPEEIVAKIYNFFQSPSKPSDYLKLLPLSRKHYDKFILRLYSNVTLNAKNAELFFYGLGPRFGCPPPSKDFIQALRNYGYLHRLAGSESDTDQTQLDVPPDFVDHENAEAAIDVRAKDASHILPFVRLHSLTDPFVRKSHLMNHAVTTIFIEDCEALLRIAEAGEEAHYTPEFFELNYTLFRHLSYLSLGQPFLERYALSRSTWDPILWRLLPLAMPEHLCIQLPKLPHWNARKSMTRFLETVSAEDQSLKSVTFHNVDRELLGIEARVRYVDVEKVRLFLRTDWTDQERDHAKSGCDDSAEISKKQKELVVDDLRIIRMGAQEERVPPERRGWDKAEYLNFLPAEAESFNAEEDFGEEEAAQYAGDFYGRNQGEPCQVCGGR